MRNKKEYILILAISFILVVSYISTFTNWLDDKLVFNCFALFIIFIVTIYIINLVINYNKNLGTKSQDKLFSLLVENSDTVYIMLDVKSKKIIYLSNNIEDVLGIKNSNNKDSLFLELFNSPSLKSEFKNMDNNDEYVGQMIEYDNPKYNHQMWIRLKSFNYKEKNDEYKVIEIVDVTKVHDHQHLLITQATDIKARERQLNQITAKSYAMEINVNISSNTYDLKYFKKDNMYFGEERRGLYTEGLKEIASKYINKSDVDEFLSKLSIENLKEHFEKFELNSEVIRYRIGNEVKNNTWLESTIFFLSNRQQTRVSILTKNVTESAESIREQNVMLQNALNDAKIASKSKTDLISTISHDIRIPLTNIIGLSESLLNKDLNENINDDIKSINESSNEVLTIIDGLLDTSKIEKKLIEKEETQYSILKLFKRIEETTKEYIGNKNIEVNLNMNSNLPVILYGDSKRIANAVMQIINNSIKYTDEGRIDIDVKGEKKDNSLDLIVEISDTGIGIDEQKLNSIMNSNEGNKGINSVKNIVKLLDGKFEIESKVNEYTKVTLYFNQRIVEDNKVREMMNNNKSAEVFSLKGKKILIVDDNTLNLKVTSRLLEPYELDITLLQNGKECIDKINEQNNFDLIMLDQMMPGLDGVSTLKKLKEIENFNTPVVILTADAMVGQKEKYLSEGFDDYISKPIDKKELSRVLSKFLRNH